MASQFPLVNVSPNNPVFDLPIYVARDEGLFAKAGIDVRFQAKYSERSGSNADPFKRLKESLFEQGKADVYNLCEWAGIDRSEHSKPRRAGAALRPAVGAQAILSFDASIQEPPDLAGVPVGINDKTGSHYTTLQSLEGVLRAQGHRRRAPRHSGEPLRGAEGRKEPRVAVMEPFISLGLKEGAHLVDVTFYPRRRGDRARPRAGAALALPERDQRSFRSHHGRLRRNTSTTSPSRPRARSRRTR
jgi:NitT/TauT family transport system substrate-binding protein